MKKTFFLIAILLAITLNAQGRRANNSAIHAEYGYMPSNENLKDGYTAKIGYVHVFGDKGFLGKTEAFYQSYEVNYIDAQILPYQKYGININAGYSYEGLYPLILNAWVGAFGASENVNKGNQSSPLYNAEIPEKVKGFVYGISGSAEAEIILARKISFLASYTQFYDFKSKFSKSNYGIFGGLRFYIN